MYLKSIRFQERERKWFARAERQNSHRRERGRKWCARAEKRNFLLVKLYSEHNRSLWCARQMNDVPSTCRTAGACCIWQSFLYCRIFSWVRVRGKGAIRSYGTRRNRKYTTRHDERPQDKIRFTTRSILLYDTCRTLSRQRGSCWTVISCHNIMDNTSSSRGKWSLAKRWVNAIVLRTNSMPSKIPSLQEIKLAGIPLYDTCRTRSRRRCSCWTVTAFINTMHNKSNGRKSSAVEYTSKGWK